MHVVCALFGLVAFHLFRDTRDLFVFSSFSFPFLFFSLFLFFVFLFFFLHFSIPHKTKFDFNDAKTNLAGPGELMMTTGWHFF